MAANELSPPVPGISVSQASDEEGGPIEDEKRQYQPESQDQSVDHFNNDSHYDSSNNDELGEANNSESKDGASELSRKLNDAHIGGDDEDDDLFKAADIIGDRVLVEKDGKFELVDIAEVKAEYFMMKGIDEKLLNEQEKDEDQAASESASETGSKKEKREGRKDSSFRPKTSPLKGNPRKTLKSNRTASASVTRKNNDEYSYIKSKYAMTEHQLEMKKKREEVIARRKKEEEQRLREEMKRKRDEAESAFQAWLKAKNEEYHERKRLQSSAAGEDKGKKEQAAKEAYDNWLQEKAKQRKQERVLERRKLEDEASSFIIRERQACEEAFKRWLRQKKLEERRRLAAKKPRKQKKRRKMHKNESLPINSSSIRFTDYYGYSHTVSL